MAAWYWLATDLLFSVYNVTWLVFLTRKHYGQVTTTAGHIFELNVVLTVTLNTFMLILLVDLEVLPTDIASDLFQKTSMYSLYTAIAGSHIDTAVFLKTLNVNTMMTNTAGKIILSLLMFSYGLGIIITLVLPSPNVHQSEIFYCTYLPPRDFYLTIFPEFVALMIVLSVMGFGVFRGLQIRRTRENELSPDNLSIEELELRQDTGLRGRGTPPQGSLFTIQAAISELNQEETRQIIEEDLVIQARHP